MASWINRTVLSGSSTAANGTSSHTCTFTAATSGNFLMAVVAGAVTFSTPSGWTLRQSAVNYAGIYVFTKSASSGEASFTTTHNGSNYPIRGVIYEFYAGTSYLAGNSNSSQLMSSSGPTVSGLAGTYTRLSARAINMSVDGGTATCAWTLPTIEDYDDYAGHGATDGIMLSIAYDDGSTGSTFTPSSVITPVGNGTPSGEGVAWALNATQPPAPTNTATIPWFVA